MAFDIEKETVFHAVAVQSNKHRSKRHVTFQLSSFVRSAVIVDVVA